MNYQTDQVNFWAGEFGNDYISRNDSEAQRSSDVALWCRILEYLDGSNSFFEFGCNIGLNLDALKQINSSFQLGGVEINQQAKSIAQERGHSQVQLGSITEPFTIDSYDVCFTSGVLIHINPEKLPQVYKNLYENSNKFVVMIENYNPSPVEVLYRGNKEKFFKRDFAGEFMDKYDFKLKGYGFVYHRDNYFPQGDINWFVLVRK